MKANSQSHKPCDTPSKGTQRYWVHDASRQCRITTGKDFATEAAKDGFREVSIYQLEAFRAATRLATENGWAPGSRKLFRSFLPALA